MREKDGVVLRVVRGNPSDEELAALLAVVSRRGGSEPPPKPVRFPWGTPALRTALPHGPGAWRASFLPR